MDICTEEDLKKGIAHYMGQIRYVDDSVGRILRYLKENNLDKDTVILFFADHGELLGRYNMTHKIPVFYDCLSKIPVILYHPEKYHGIRFKGLVEEVDIVPTLLDMLDIPIPGTMVGRSLVEHLKQGKINELMFLLVRRLLSVKVRKTEGMGVSGLFAGCTI